MLENLKQLEQLKSLHDAMRSEQYTVERNGITVTLTGALVLESVTIAEEVPREEIASRLVAVFNDTLRKAQGDMAQRLMRRMEH